MMTYHLPVPEFARWKRSRTEQEYPHLSKIQTEMEGAQALILMIEPCPPFLPTHEGVELSSFYVASNRLHNWASEHGHSDVYVPIKPLIAGFGVGAYGRCGITAIPGIGTRFAALVLTDDAEPDARWEWREDRDFSPECADCDGCLKNCPTGALDGSGIVDMGKCLRAQAARQTPFPESSHELIGASAWGCDLCQDICPRNRNVKPVMMPESLERALDLKKLLAGDVDELGAWIGTNYARPARMQARASLLAANLNRYDLMEDIRPLADSAVENVRACAAWALRKLNTEG